MERPVEKTTMLKVRDSINLKEGPNCGVTYRDHPKAPEEERKGFPERDEATVINKDGVRAREEMNLARNPHLPEDDREKGETVQSSKQLEKKKKTMKMW